jgi:uncharacterized phosphosugar-binding protein
MGRSYGAIIIAIAAMGRSYGAIIIAIAAMGRSYSAIIIATAAMGRSYSAIIIAIAAMGRSYHHCNRGHGPLLQCGKNLVGAAHGRDLLRLGLFVHQQCRQTAYDH